MAMPDHAGTNFQNLLCAADAGPLANMDCLDAATREPRYVLVAFVADGGEDVFTPFGHLAEGDPFASYLPPAENWGFAEPE